MTRQLTVLGLGGSTRKGSWAEALLRKALINSRSLGMRPQLYPLAAKDLPVFRESLLLDPRRWWRNSSPRPGRRTC